MALTARTATLQLLRDLGIRTLFGNPGSTELPLLGDWPDDFHYVLGLQEIVAVGMADGYAQANGQAAIVSLHSAAGVGHALGAIFTAHKNQTPMVIIAGQQERSLLPLQPFLGSHSATEFPKPYVKWSCEPARAQDVPLAIAQAYEIAMQAPCGPTFVSVPADDWAKPAAAFVSHGASRLIGPEPAMVSAFAATLNAARRVAVVYGPGVGREGVQLLSTTLAERLHADVWASPMISRDGIAGDHPNFAGFLPAVPDRLADLLHGYDCVLVVGGPAFLFHVSGNLDAVGALPSVLQITDDASSAAASPFARSLVASLSLALPMLIEQLNARPEAPGNDAQRARLAARADAVAQARAAARKDVLTVDVVMSILDDCVPDDAIFIEEIPSHKERLHHILPVRATQHSYAMASGGLGFGLPAAAGVALASPGRRVIALIGDGSAMYSIQGLWTAVQERLDVTYVIFNNKGYGAMHRFRQMMQLGKVPGIDLHGIGFMQIAQGFDCPAYAAQTPEELRQALQQALKHSGPALIEVRLPAV
jgi:benzoylformate decarboxylase